MPEGDTIRRLAERINRRFAGQRCERCVTRDPRLVHVDFTGAVLREADARGKHLLIRFDDGRTLFAHLRMDGSFRVGPAATEAAWRRRLELWMHDGRLTALDVYKAGVDRGAWYRAFTALFDTYDFLLIPAAQVFPFDAATTWPREIAGRAMDSYHRWMEVVVGATMAGCPAIGP